MIKLRRLDAASKKLWSRLIAAADKREAGRREAPERERSPASSGARVPAPKKALAPRRPVKASEARAVEGNGKGREAAKATTVAASPTAPSIKSEVENEQTVASAQKELDKASDKLFLGIDLGCSRILAAVAGENGAHCLALDKAGRGFPALVAKDLAGGFEVGAPALARRLKTPGRALVGSKRLLGRQLHSPALRRCLESAPNVFELNDVGRLSVKLDEQSAEGVEIVEAVSVLLTTVLAAAELRLGHGVRRAVVSVPSNFGDAGRRALRDAGRRTGLETLRLLDEPTAAAIAYGYGRGLPARRLLVMDLGGGSFDVSLIHVSGDRFEVIASGGDPFLGGVELDQLILRELLAGVVKKGGPLSLSSPAKERLLTEAERLKIALSEATRVSAQIDGLWTDAEGKTQGLSLELSREELEGWMEPFFEACLRLTETLLEEEGLLANQIDELLLIGGQSKTPLFHRLIEARLGHTPRDEVDPEQAVVLGCAQLGRSIELASDPRAAKVELQESLALNIGFGLSEQRFAVVLERGSRLPVNRTVRVLVEAEPKESLNFALFEGHSRELGEADFLGTLEVERPKWEGSTGETREVILNFGVDAEGCLTLGAREQESGRSLSVARVVSAAPEALQELLRSGGTGQGVEVRDLESLLRDERAPKVRDGIFGGLRRLFGNRPS